MLDPKCDLGDESCRLIIATVVADDPAETICSWQEMEIESSTLAKPVPTSVAAQKRKVEVAAPIFERRLCTEPSHAVLPAQTPNLCFTLSTLEMTEGRRELVAFLQDRKYHHYMYIARKAVGSLQSQTLEEIMPSSPLFPWIAPRKGGLVLSRRDRLHLAAKLACSVLQLHGNWLSADWSSRDIMFPRGSIEPKELLRQPFLLWSVSKCLNVMSNCRLSRSKRDSLPSGFDSY